MIGGQVQELQQRLREVTEHLDIAQAELAAAEVDKAGKDEILQEYAEVIARLEAKLEESNGNIRDLRECNAKLDRELAVSLDTVASMRFDMTAHQESHQSCQQECDVLRKNLDRIQGELEGRLEVSFTQNRDLRERASKNEQHLTELTSAVLSQCNAMNSAMQAFLLSCGKVYDSKACPADAHAQLVASLQSLSKAESAVVEEALPGSGVVTPPQVSADVNCAVEAIESLSKTMLQGQSLFTNLANLDLIVQLQKRDAQALELEQRLGELEAYQADADKEGARLEQELYSACMKLKASDAGLQRAEHDGHKLAQELQTAQHKIKSLQQDLDDSVQASDARQVEVKRTEDQCLRQQMELEGALKRCHLLEADAQAAEVAAQSLRNENTDINARLQALELSYSGLLDTEKLMKVQLGEADAKVAELQDRAKEQEEAALHLQATCNALEDELDVAYQELDNAQQKETEAQVTLSEIKAQCTALEHLLRDTRRSWLSPEAASSLRLEAEEAQKAYKQIEYRYASLLDDFKHLSDRKEGVETERRRQHEHRRRVTALHAGLQQVQNGMADLEDRCCHEIQNAAGIVCWAVQCIEFAERMQKDFSDALSELDAAITAADLPGLQKACLSAFRQRIGQLASQPAGYAPQLVSVRRMEERVEQLKKQLTTKQEAEHTLRTAVQGLQKENHALQQNNAELRDELSVCARASGAAELVSAEARDLRVRVDQLTSMHRSMFGRMLRLAVLATEKQESTMGFPPAMENDTGDNCGMTEVHEVDEGTEHVVRSSAGEYTETIVVSIAGSHMEGQIPAGSVSDQTAVLQQTGNLSSVGMH